MKWIVLLALAACSPTAASSMTPGGIPYELTVCPGPVAMPAAMPRIHTVEALDQHDLEVSSALRISEARRRACAETLERLVEWTEER